MFAQTPSTLAILGDEGEEVEGAADGGETDKSKGDGATLDVHRSIAGQETKGSDDGAAVAEADLEGGTNAAPQVSTDYLMRTSGKKSEEGIHIDSLFVPNQQIIMGAAAYSPIAAKNNAPYLTFTLL